MSNSGSITQYEVIVAYDDTKKYASTLQQRQRKILEKFNSVGYQLILKLSNTS